MTVDATNSYSTGTGNGVATAFPFTFFAKTEAEIAVCLGGVLQVAGYTVVVNSGGAGGTVTFTTAPANGVAVIIASNPSFTQSTSFANAGAYLPASHDTALDRAAARDIYLKERVNRALLAPRGETLSELPSAASRAGKTLTFDGSGNPVAASLVVTSAPGQSVSTRALLAAIATPGPSQSAILTESGREGTFVFSSANLSTQVTADTAQGIYVAPSTDTTGASGAWVRKYSIMAMAEWFGAKGDGTTDDSAAINAALVACNALGVGALSLAPGKTYSAGTTIILLKSNVRLFGPGATISSSASFVVGDETASTGHSIQGVKFVQTGNNQAKYCYDFSGSNGKLLDVEFVKSPAIDGYIGYFRGTTSTWRIDGFKCSGSNGIFLEGHDHNITNWDCVNGGFADDCWVVKGAATQTYNIKISNGTAHGYGAAVSFGSEIGLGGVNDPLYQYYVRNIAVENVIADKCQQCIYIKPGAVGGVNYFDGTLEDVRVSNCHLIDPTGTTARRFAYITAGRGARVRNIRFNNCTARYRAPDRSTGANAGIAILGNSFTGGTAATVIDGIFVNGISIVDPFGGVASGTAGTSGYPVDHGFHVDLQTSGGGTNTDIRRIEINDLYVNGCARNAISLAATVAATGPIRLRRPVLLNYTAGELGTTDRASIHSAASKIEVHDMEAVPSSGAAAGTRGVMGDNAVDKTIEIVGEKTTPVAVPTVTAGNTATATIFTAPVDCWIRKVEIACTSAVTASDTNFTTIQVTNRSTNNNIISVTTKITGGLAIPAFTPTSLNGTTQFTGNDAYLPKGKSLVWSNSNSGGGTGTALTNPAFIVHYVPYAAGV